LVGAGVPLGCWTGPVGGVAWAWAAAGAAASAAAARISGRRRGNTGG